MTKHMFVKLPAVLSILAPFGVGLWSRVCSCSFDLDAAVVALWLPLALVAQQMVELVE